MKKKKKQHAFKVRRGSKRDRDMELVKETLELLSYLKHSNMFDKTMVKTILSTFVGALQDMPAFHKYLANPKSDLTNVEPLMKYLLKKKGKK